MSTGEPSADPPPAKKKKQYYRRKRRFYGNQYTTSKEDPAPSEAVKPTASSQKLGAAVASTSRTATEELTGYRLFDISILCDFVKSVACRDCGDSDYSVSETRFGLSSSLRFTCNSCLKEFELKNSQRDNLNTRFTSSLFSIGCHYREGQRFLMNMNMPPPVSREAFGKTKRKIATATATAAQSSMSQAARELADAYSDDEVVVSCDGTWQRRGFASKNGVATVLSVNPRGPAKVVDTQVLSNYCDACAKSKKKRQGGEFQEWYKGHKEKCQKNHEGSAGQMEPAGMLQVFQRSQAKHGLKYVGYLGDGDSKSFSTVSKASPPIYGDTVIKKLECCGHVQKRMGRKLMDAVSANKSKQFSEGGKTYKGIGGVGRPTQKAIKRIQGHYGAAIRNNIGDVGKMKKGIMAIWKHRGGEHSDCEDWCPAKHGDLTRANASVLPRFVLEIIQPIFEELSGSDLLSKCAHGGTQNPNENFHSLIWARCPKDTFVGRDRLETAVNEAAIVYNEGETGRLQVFSRLGLAVGRYMAEGFRALDVARVQASITLSTSEAKVKRKQKRVSAAAGKAGDGSYQYGGGD